MTTPTSDHPAADNAISPRLSRILTLLAALGTASALWAIFLWRELLAARAGEDPFCGFGESADCGALWSAKFATTIHSLTGVPVAGWGLAWGLVAMALPLIALGSARRRDTATTAVELTAAAGLAGIVVLLTASAAEGLFCTSCALTYILTAGYAAIAFFGLRRAAIVRSPHGVTMAVAATLAAYGLLLYPGLKTPKSLADEGQRALAAAAKRTATQQTTGTSSTEAAPGEVSPGEATTETPGTIPTRTSTDDRLDELLASLPPPALQFLSDSIGIYREASDLGSLEPRVLTVGTLEAAVRITEFTDVLCSHCANLHQTVDYLAGLLPPGSFGIDARHFPLDGDCNPHLQSDGEESVRCLAARVQICIEDTGNLFEYSGELFKNQKGLTETQVYDLAKPFIDRPTLDSCVASKATQKKLSDDIDYAWRHKPHGTPLVLVNGRQGTQFGPFLYAMILSGADPDHPAFKTLPPPKPPAPHDHEH